MFAELQMLSERPRAKLREQTNFEDYLMKTSQVTFCGTLSSSPSPGDIDEALAGTIRRHIDGHLYLYSLLSSHPGLSISPITSTIYR